MTTRSRWRPQDVAVLAQGAATLIYAASDTFADVDLWWHLRLGDDIWARGGLPWRDIYSYLSKDGPYAESRMAGGTDDVARVRLGRRHRSRRF